MEGQARTQVPRAGRERLIPEQNKYGVQGAGGMEAERLCRICRLRPPPGDPLPSFPSLGKKAAPQGGIPGRTAKENISLHRAKRTAVPIPFDLRLFFPDMGYWSL